MAFEIFFKTPLKTINTLFFPKVTAIFLITRHVSWVFSKRRRKELREKGTHWCIKHLAENGRCFSVLKLTWIFISLSRFQRGHKILCGAATGQCSRHGYEYSSNGQSQTCFLMRTTELPKACDPRPDRDGHVGRIFLGSRFSAPLHQCFQ